MARSWMVLAVLLAFAACGGDSSTGPDMGGNGGNSGDSRVVKLDPSFQSDVQEIFDRRGCSASSCHGSAEAAGLRLTDGSSHSELVGVPATTEAGTRVIAGDAQASYLVIKIEGRQNVGGRMPVGGSALDTIDVKNIRNWIDQGAKNN
jgi:hypothetical protein